MADVLAVTGVGGVGDGAARLILQSDSGDPVATGAVLIKRKRLRKVGRGKYAPVTSASSAGVSSNFGNCGNNSEEGDDLDIDCANISEEDNDLPC